MIFAYTSLKTKHLLAGTKQIIHVTFDTNIIFVCNQLLFKESVSISNFIPTFV